MSSPDQKPGGGPNNPEIPEGSSSQDCAGLESERDMLSRVRLMAEPDQATWDLSEKDQSAIRYVVGRLRATEKRTRDALDILATAWNEPHPDKAELLRGIGDAMAALEPKP